MFLLYLLLFLPPFHEFWEICEKKPTGATFKKILFPRVIPPICFYNLLVKDNMSDKAR